MRVIAHNVAGARLDQTSMGTRGLDGDIYLLTEAKVRAGSPGAHRTATLGRDGKDRPWSAAVLSPHPVSEISDAQATWRGHAKAVPFVCSRDGTWVAARVEIPGAPAITAVSLYGLMDETADASVHRSLSELSPLLDDPRYSKHLVIGGDLNIGTQWPAHEAVWNRRDGSVLDRLRGWGLVDCLDAKRVPGPLPGCRCTLGDECRHVRTRRDGRHPDTPYQNDYLFASPTLAKGLEACEALLDDTSMAGSDHAPIVATFNPANWGTSSTSGSITS